MFSVNHTVVNFQVSENVESLELLAEVARPRDSAQ